MRHRALPLPTSRKSWEEIGLRDRAKRMAREGRRACDAGAVASVPRALVAVLTLGVPALGPISLLDLRAALDGIDRATQGMPTAPRAATRAAALRMFLAERKPPARAAARAA